jgi:hypothetical protein
MAKPGDPVKVQHPAAKPADEKKLEKQRAALDAAKALAAAASALTAGWESSGFYDRQDPALAIALHEALAAYESSA